MAWTLTPRVETEEDLLLCHLQGKQDNCHYSLLHQWPLTAFYPTQVIGSVQAINTSNSAPSRTLIHSSKAPNPFTCSRLLTAPLRSTPYRSETFRCWRACAWNSASHLMTSQELGEPVLLRLTYELPKGFGTEKDNKHLNAKAHKAKLTSTEFHHLFPQQNPLKRTHLFLPRLGASCTTIWLGPSSSWNSATSVSFSGQCKIPTVSIFGYFWRKEVSFKAPRMVMFWTNQSWNVFIPTNKVFFFPKCRLRSLSTKSQPVGTNSR